LFIPSPVSAASYIFATCPNFSIQEINGKMLGVPVVGGQTFGGFLIIFVITNPTRKIVMVPNTIVRLL
jgi:hypothetical protein